MSGRVALISSWERVYIVAQRGVAGVLQYTAGGGARVSDQPCSRVCEQATALYLLMVGSSGHLRVVSKREARLGRRV